MTDLWGGATQELIMSRIEEWEAAAEKWRNDRPLKGLLTVDVVPSSDCENVKIIVRAENVVTENDEMKIGRWLRGLAASMDVFFAPVVMVNTDDDRYGVEAIICVPIESSVHIGDPWKDSDEFWVVGDLDRKVYLAVKNDDGWEDTFVDTSAVDDAIHFDTRDDAVAALWKDSDIVAWVDEQPDPVAIRPLRVERVTTISIK